MDIIKRLPSQLALHVYLYDDTYKQKFESVIYVLKNSNSYVCHYDCTQYPQLYCNTTWGNFSIPRKNMFLKNNFKTIIIHNRNIFVEQYNIIKHKQRKIIFDNVRRRRCTELNEYYKDKSGNYLHVFSNLNHEDFTVFDDYTIIYPLCSENRTTFIKYLPQLKPKKNG